MINFGESLINVCFIMFHLFSFPIIIQTNAMISFWLAFLTIYAIYGSLFFDTVLFNSDYMAPLLDPMTEQEGVTYSNNFLYFHNISAAVLLVTVYTSLCLVWRFREVKNFSAQAMKFQKSVSFQGYELKSSSNSASPTINLHLPDLCSTCNIFRYTLLFCNSEMVLACFWHFVSAQWR